MSTLDDLEARVDWIEEQLQEMATFGYGETSGADLAEYNVDSQDETELSVEEQLQALWRAFLQAAKAIGLEPGYSSDRVPFIQHHLDGPTWYILDCNALEGSNV